MALTGIDSKPSAVISSQGASKETKPSLEELGGGGGAAQNTNPTDVGKTVTASDIALMEVSGKMQQETGAMPPAVTDGDGKPAVGPTKK